MRYIILDENNIVTSIRYGMEIVDNEIESSYGELGQKMLEDGTFIDVEKPTTEEPTTIEEQILAENQYQTALLEMQMLGGM